MVLVFGIGYGKWNGMTFNSSLSLIRVFNQHFFFTQVLGGIFASLHMTQCVFQSHTSSVGEFRYPTFCISVFVIFFFSLNFCDLPRDLGGDFVSVFLDANLALTLR